MAAPTAMPADLLLWRHAQAELLQAGQADLERRLTPRGQRQAEAMGRWLHPRLPRSTLVWVSPAVRTQQTAAALGRSFITQAGLVPEASPESIGRLLACADAAGPVLLVGHQPTLGQLAAGLLAGQALEWSIKKGALWWLRQRQRPEEPARWTLRLVLSAEDVSF